MPKTKEARPTASQNKLATSPRKKLTAAPAPRSAKFPRAQSAAVDATRPEKDSTRNVSEVGDLAERCQAIAEDQYNADENRTQRELSGCGSVPACHRR